jgi:hypothetical protein
MSCPPVDLTGPAVMTLPKHLGDIREPHPAHCHMHTRQTCASILACPNEPSTRGEPLRTESALLRPNSVWGVNRPANSAVLVTDLARRPILQENVFFWRNGNEKPHVPDRSRPCDTFWGRLWRQPRQPIRPIPEAVQVIRGAASNAVARRVWICRCNARQLVHFVRIRNNPHQRRLHGGAGDGSRLIRCGQSLRCGRHR